MHFDFDLSGPNWQKGLTMAAGPSDPSLDRQYWAFISYRHADNKEEGRLWASWLHQQLETYEVPSDLVGKTNERGEEIPSRIFPVFRDEEELGAGNLTERIFKALDNSQVLVVLCSPRTLDSDYVREEIRYFKKIGKADHVYAALLEGDPLQSFPETLRFNVDSQGAIDPAKELEALAADFRLPDGVQGWTTPEAYRQALSKEAGLSKGEISKRVTAYSSRLDLAKLKLIAGILGVPLGTLQKRDEKHQLRLSRRRARTLRLWLGAVGLMAAAAIWKTGESRRQRDDARRNEAQGWMLRAEVAEKEGKQYPNTLLYAARAIGFDGLGREEKKGMTPYDYLGDFFPLVSRPDETPRLWRSWVDSADYKRARDWIKKRPNYLPVWSSELRDSSVTGLSLSPEGRYLAISSEDGSIRLWDFASDEEPQVIEGGVGIVFDFAFNPDGKRLALAGGGKVRVWNRESDAFEWEAEALVSAVAYNASGQILAGAAQDGSILLWDGEALSKVDLGQESPAIRLTFSPDDSALAAVYPQVGARLVFHHYGEPHLSWAEHPREDVMAVTFSPDGKMVALGHEDGLVSLWETVSARLHGQIVPQHRHESSVLDLSFRHDGEQLASASADATVKLWRIDLNLPEIEATLVGHRDEVRRVRYAPGGSLLASAGTDGTSKLWDVSGQTGTELKLFPYLAKNWYGFDENNQMLWKQGSGFLNLPTNSVAWLFRENQGQGAYVRFIESGNWTGAALVAGESEREQLADLLKLEVDIAAGDSQLHLARLHMEHLARIKGDKGLDGLREKARTVAIEGSDFSLGKHLDFVWCPAGRFKMGSPDTEEGRFRSESQHKVTLTSGYWISAYEVTQANYEAVMGINPSSNVDSSPEAPVENLSWNEAMEFCRKFTDLERARGRIPIGWEFMLPTSAQWEYAARAGTTTPYYFGDDTAQLYKYGNFNDRQGGFPNYDHTQDDGYKYAAPVGSYIANAWGLYDTIGNVWEWCLDGSPQEHELVPVNAESRLDPLDRGPLRVYRGGGINAAALECRSAFCGPFHPSYRANALGFRSALVRTSHQK